MTHPIAMVTKTLILASLMIGALAVPAHAASASTFGKPGSKCLTLQQSAHALKRMNYRNVTNMMYAGEPYRYAFSGDTRKNGKRFAWYLVYDGCDRQIISKQLQGTRPVS